MLHTYKLPSLAIFCGLIFVFSISTIVHSHYLEMLTLHFHIGNPTKVLSYANDNKLISELMDIIELENPGAQLYPSIQESV